MPILNRTDIDGNKAGRIVNINWSIWKELDLSILASFKLEEDLFLPDFGKVEFVFIKGLKDLINSELSWPLLEVTTLVKLGNETIFTRNHLGFTGGNIIAKKSSLHAIFPLSKKKRVEECEGRLPGACMQGQILPNISLLETIQRQLCIWNATSFEAIPTTTSDGTRRVCSVVFLEVGNDSGNPLDFEHHFSEGEVEDEEKVIL